MGDREPEWSQKPLQKERKNIAWEGGWCVSAAYTQRGLSPTGLWAQRTMDLPSPNMKCYEIVLATAPLAALLHVVSELRGLRENDLQIGGCLLKFLGHQKDKNLSAVFRSLNVHLHEEHRFHFNIRA